MELHNIWWLIDRATGNSLVVFLDFLSTNQHAAHTALPHGRCTVLSLERLLKHNFIYLRLSREWYIGKYRIYVLIRQPCWIEPNLQRNDRVHFHQKHPLVIEFQQSRWYWTSYLHKLPGDLEPSHKKIRFTQELTNWLPFCKHWCLRMKRGCHMWLRRHRALAYNFPAVGSSYLAWLWLILYAFTICSVNISGQFWLFSIIILGFLKDHGNVSIDDAWKRVRGEGELILYILY